jgi:HEPN domain-containing protein
MNNNKHDRGWISLAEKAFRLAESDAASRPLPKMDIICMLCKQSAEMQLKGYLEASGEEIPETRDLCLVLDECSKIDAAFSDLEDCCKRLGMYEDMHNRNFEISWTDLEMALMDADEVRTFVSRLLPENQDGDFGMGKWPPDDLPF